MKSIIMCLYLALKIFIIVSCDQPDEKLEQVDAKLPVKLNCLSNDYKDCVVVASEIPEEPVNIL